MAVACLEGHGAIFRVAALTVSPTQDAHISTCYTQETCIHYAFVYRVVQC